MLKPQSCWKACKPQPTTGTRTYSQSLMPLRELKDVLRALRLTGSMRRSRTRCKSVVEFVISTLCFTAADKDLTWMHGDRKSYALQRAARIPYLQVNLFWASVSVDLCHGRPRGFEVLPHDHDTRYTKTW